MKEIVYVKDNALFTDSIEIANGVNHTHTSVLKLINASKDMEIFAALNAVKIQTKGRPSDIYYLSEEQATLLIALMRNTPIVREFKNKLVREFYRLKRKYQSLLAEKTNVDYLLRRDESKTIRLEETDWIKAFVNYATEQGSQSAHMYYITISKMENKALFFLDQKVKNVRELLDFKQLSLIQVADQIVINAIKEGLEKKLHYKEIYQDAKKRIETFASVIPKSPLAFLQLEKKENKQ
jgi:phage regulator Rha-like protein